MSGKIIDFNKAKQPYLHARQEDKVKEIRRKFQEAQEAALREEKARRIKKKKK